MTSLRPAFCRRSHQKWTGHIEVFCVLAFSFASAARAEAPLGPPSTPPAVAPSFLVQPYLQLPKPTSMTVMWETDQKLPARVEFGTTAKLGQSAEVATPATLHQVRLQGLAPGTTYHYRVRSGPLTSGVFTFKTVSSGTKRWRMAVYGDSRSNPAVHRKIAEQMARANVDLIVHTGDIVLSGKNHLIWRLEFFEPLGQLIASVPWVSTIGNHERDADNFFSYTAQPGKEHYFSFDFGNAHIVCLDSNAWIEKGRDSAQFEWLQADLRRQRPTTWTFVAFHHALFSAHANRPINPLRWDWAPLLLDPANHVDGVLTGHDHFYARNHRLGLLGDTPQPGVFFLTTAGGGANLYKSRQRDYVAQEKSVHHFTLFEVDGQRITVSAIDLAGTVFDRYVLTREPTPPEEFCAYEIEELRQHLRQALAAATPQPLSVRGATRIETRLRVPTRFRVPVAGQLRWQAPAGWKLKQASSDFHLRPGQVLEIPLEAEVAAGPFSGSPLLTIAFEPGRFRNRTLEVYPFKLAGPERVSVGQVTGDLIIDGKLDEASWQRAGAASLLGMPPPGGRGDQVQVLADDRWLYVGAQLDDPSARVRVKPLTAEPGHSRLIYYKEHVRVVLADGQETRTFAVSPDQDRYYSAGSHEDTTTRWQAAAGQKTKAWCVEMALPRELFKDLTKVRINVVHHRREEKGFVDYELCPTYGLGNDPDVIPDWRPVENVERFAALEQE